MSLSRQHAFCVVGMVIAGMLAHNDVHMGAHLLESQSDNPLGFYEDNEFVRFHEDCLDRRGWTYADPGCLRIEFDDDERRRAVKLVEARSGCGFPITNRNLMRCIENSTHNASKDRAFAS